MLPITAPDPKFPIDLFPCLFPIPHFLIFQGYTSFTQEQFIAALSRCVDKQLADRELLASEIQKQYDNKSSENLVTPKKTVSREERDHIHTNGIDSR